MGEIFTQGVSPTFLNLKNQLATMYGASEVADLQAIDQQRVGIYVNQAYRECYSPIDGKRPNWAKNHFGLDFKAPNSLTLDSLSDGGSTATASESLSSNYEGSFLKIGADFYVIARISGTSITLVEPYNGTGGNGIAATLYHSAHRMDREVIDVDMVPEVVGKGPLSPMASPEVAARVRAIYTFDFLPGRSWGKLPSIRNNGEELEIDTPVFYFVDNSALTIPNTSSAGPPAAGLQSMDELAVRPRFNVYPLPDADYSIRGTANILPHELTADGDMARLPGNVVWDILFPIALAKLALTDPRYNGGNTEAVNRSAEEARQRLKTFTNAQKHRNIRMVRRAGY
jgi:hypothetical protein